MAPLAVDPPAAPKPTTQGDTADPCAAWGSSAASLGPGRPAAGTGCARSPERWAPAATPKPTTRVDTAVGPCGSGLGFVSAEFTRVRTTAGRRAAGLTVLEPQVW